MIHDNNQHQNHKHLIEIGLRKIRLYDTIRYIYLRSKDDC